MSVRDEVRKFLSRYIRITEFQDDTNILDSMMVNSLFIMQLVAFVEDHFDIALDNDDIVMEHFMNINSIADLIETKQKKD